MIIQRQEDVTKVVTEAFKNTQPPRLREILISLVEHLHAFARDVDLKGDEWFKAIEFLTACGKACDDKRQEFILLSDTLGLSMLTVALNNQKPAGCTEATVSLRVPVRSVQRVSWDQNLLNPPQRIQSTAHFALASDVKAAVRPSP